MTTESLPHWMLTAAAKVGKSAHHQGYSLLSLKKNEAIIITMTEKTAHLE